MILLGKLKWIQSQLSYIPVYERYIDVISLFLKMTQKTDRFRKNNF
jgi:hypothetical protein